MTVVLSRVLPRYAVRCSARIPHALIPRALLARALSTQPTNPQPTNPQPTNPQSKGATQATPSQADQQTQQKNSESESSLDITTNIWTIPNALSMARIGFSPYMSYLFLTSQYREAAALFMFLSFTDWLDGAIAKHFKGQRSLFGSYLDPMADKIVVNTVTLSLFAQSLLPGWLVGLIFVRDAGLIGGTIAHRISSLSSVSIKSFFQVTNIPFEVQPSTVSKLNTALTMLMIGGTIATKAVYLAADPPNEIAMGLLALQYAVGAATFGSGAHYLLAGAKTFQRARRASQQQQQK